jgi:folate-binding protein YgfZ
MPPGDEVETARQYDALDSGAGVSLLDGRAILAARGSDRASFLQGMLSNEVAKLVPGQGAEALLLTEQGKVVAALRAYVLADEIWLDVEQVASAAVRSALERFIVADDVELEERALAGVALRGPRSAEVLGRAIDGESRAGSEAAHTLAATAESAHLEVEVAGVPLRAVRCRDLGIDGFHLWAPDRSAASAVRSALCAAGATAVDAPALEAARIARRVAREGVDFDRETLAPEVPSLARAISFKKGCYLGQEVIERVAARGHVNWVIAALAAEGREVPAIGAAAFAEDREVGRVTSAVRLPGRDAIAMLARVRRTAAEPGTALAVESAGRRIEARVVGPTSPEG